MTILVSIVATFLCMPWPAMIMMSPMMIAAPNFASKQSNIIMAMLFFIYPTFVFLVLKLIDLSFYGTNPIWWALATCTIGMLVSILYGLPRQLYNLSRGISNYDYFIKNNSAYLNGKKIKGADTNSFTFFSKTDYYSKDKSYVYYHTKKLKDADAATFQALAKDTTNSYWHDKKNVYFKWKKIADADGESFNYIGQQYAHDKNHVFFEDQLLKDADKETFQCLKSFVGRDAKNVFVRAIQVTNIKDLASFEMISIDEESFGKDKDQIYALRYTPPLPLIPFPNADMETFEVIGEFYAKDKNQVYYYAYHIPDIKVLEHANPETFILHFDQIRRTNANDGERYYKSGVLYIE